ncbi:hypothetical protein BKA82DRAFT_4016993 [Pisolithus tinctorius]|nr:hypothetical protein BKA82DRAFT_4016993 [Pisolithus tinctorius]
MAFPSTGPAVLVMHRYTTVASSALFRLISSHLAHDNCCAGIGHLLFWPPRIRFTYALQQANNPSDRLPDDWYQQVQVETHILKQALATCNTYGTIMKVPHVANELLWWMAVQNMGETALLAHIMELNVLQVKRGEVRRMIHTWSYATYLVDKGPYPSGWEVLQEAKEFFVGVEEGKESLPLLCDMDRMPSDSIGQDD